MAVKTIAELNTELFNLLKEGLPANSQSFLDDVRDSYNSMEAATPGSGDKMLSNLVANKTKAISISR